MACKIIYFVKFGRFSNTNLFVEQQLRRVFPEANLKVLDIKAFFTRPSLALLLVLLKLSPRLFWQAIRVRLKLKDLSFVAIQMLLREPRIFRAIGDFARNQIELDRPNVWFTIQTQSLWDNTCEGIPNFIYTDSAALTNLYYTGADKRMIPSKPWLDQERALYAKATRIFVMSDHVQSSLHKQYGQSGDRVKKVRVGANLTLPVGDLTPRPETNKTILFVGVDWERKGGPQLLDAFKRLADRHRDAKLVIVGVSPAIEGQGIEIVGRVPSTEVGNYYLEAAIFCLPTRIEPFGIVFIEAMLHKLAVVAPSQGAMTDFIRHKETGVLVKPGDTDELVDALNWLLDHPFERRQIADRGYQAIHKDYGWDRVGDRLREEIEAVTGP